MQEGTITKAIIISTLKTSLFLNKEYVVINHDSEEIS